MRRRTSISTDRVPVLARSSSGATSQASAAQTWRSSAEDSPTRAGCASRSCRGTSGAARSSSSVKASTESWCGDRVVCEGMIPCTRCSRCKEGETQLCLNYDQIGFTRAGGYGEYVSVPRHVVHRLPDAVSFAAGVLVEPAACVLRGLERAGPQPGERIGVIGIGTLGSLALTLARPTRRARSSAMARVARSSSSPRTLGADTVVHVTEEDAVEATKRAVGDGLDIVVETAGAVDAVELATRLVRPGGRIVLLGIAGEGKVLELPPTESCSGTCASSAAARTRRRPGHTSFDCSSEASCSSSRSSPIASPPTVSRTRSRSWTSVRASSRRSFSSTGRLATRGRVHPPAPFIIR